MLVEDGDDTSNWIAAQPWSDGKVGTIGGSYLGYVQWAAAASGNPHLRAMVSVVCAGSAFQDLPRKGGAFVSGILAWAFAVSKQEFKPELMLRDDWDEVLNIRPLEDLTLTGDFMVELFVSPDAPDTDFVVRINDVDQQGTSI